MTSCNGNLVTYLLPTNYHYPLFIGDRQSRRLRRFVLSITFITESRRPSLLWLYGRLARDARACARRILVL